MSTFLRTISPETLKAYQEAIFSINAKNQVITFQVDHACGELSSFLKLMGVSGAALITAYNPYSEALSREDNERLQAQLAQELKNRNIAFIEGEGRDAAGLWDAEPSLFALNISLETAQRLANQFEQNAFVWVEGSAPPSLRLMFPVST